MDEIQASDILNQMQHYSARLDRKKKDSKTPLESKLSRSNACIDKQERGQKHEQSSLQKKAQKRPQKLAVVSLAELPDEKLAVGRLAELPDELRSEMRNAGFKSQMGFACHAKRLVATRHDRCIVGPPNSQPQKRRRTGFVGMVHRAKTTRQKPVEALCPHHVTSLEKRDELISEHQIIVENDQTQILRIGSLEVNEHLY